MNAFNNQNNDILQLLYLVGALKPYALVEYKHTHEIIKTEFDDFNDYRTASKNALHDKSNIKIKCYNHDELQFEKELQQ